MALWPHHFPWPPGCKLVIFLPFPPHIHQQGLAAAFPPAPSLPDRTPSFHSSPAVDCSLSQPGRPYRNGSRPQSPQLQRASCLLPSSSMPCTRPQPQWLSFSFPHMLHLCWTQGFGMAFPLPGTLVLTPSTPSHPVAAVYHLLRELCPDFCSRRNLLYDLLQVAQLFWDSVFSSVKWGK